MGWFCKIPPGCHGCCAFTLQLGIVLFTEFPVLAICRYHCLALISPVAVGVPALAAAERELHFVGSHEGNTETEGQLHGPQAHVRLDRTGVQVSQSDPDVAPVGQFRRSVEGARRRASLSGAVR